MFVVPNLFFQFLIGYMFQFPFRDLFSRSSGSHFPDFQGGPSGLLFRSLRTSSLIPEQLAMPHVAIGPRSLLIRDFNGFHNGPLYRIFAA